MSKGNVKTILMWVFSLALSLGMFLIPTSEVFTSQMRVFLAVTIFAILAIALETLPKSAVTLLLPVVYILLGLADPTAAWYPWTMPTVWMLIGAMLLVNVLESSGVLMRISYKTILMVGGSYKGIILGMGVLGVILNIILFGNGFAILAGLAYGLCRALNLKKFSKEACGIFIAAAISGTIPAIFCYGSNAIMLEGIGEPVVGVMRISYMDYTFFCLPFVLYFILALLLVLVLFRSNAEINGKAYFQEKLSELGVMQAKEKRAIAWLAALFATVIFFGFKGMDSTWAFIIFPILMILPTVGCGSEDDVKNLDFTFILFVASCMSIGFVASALGFGGLITELALPLTENASPTVVAYLIYMVNVILNFLLTPMAIMAGFTTTFLQIGTSLGINPYVIYAMELIGTDQILFPYEYALVLLYFSFGYIGMKDFVKYFGAKMLLCAVFLPVVVFPFWKLFGLFFV